MTSRRETLRGALWMCGQALLKFACCAALFSHQAEAVPIFSKIRGMGHLPELGYLSAIDPGSNQGIRFVLHPGINLTDTELNSGSAHAITPPEGLLREFVVPKTGRRTKRYVLDGSTWDKKNLKYKITKYSTQLSKKEVDETIAGAFGVWSKYTDLTFSTGSGEVDIKISFEHGDHGDAEPFSANPHSSMGHALGPGGGGEIHFNDDRDWTITRDDEHNLFSAAVVLTGFSLGLDRSDAISSVTNNRFALFDPNSELPTDDIEGIQALYGRKSVDKVSEGCLDSRVDALFNSADGSETYIFKGKYFWKTGDNGEIFPGYPKLIATTWYGLPDNIDMAYTDELGETYIHKGSTYWKYVGEQLSPGWPKEIGNMETPLSKNLWKDLIESRRRIASLTLIFECFFRSFTAQL